MFDVLLSLLVLLLDLLVPDIPMPHPLASAARRGGAAFLCHAGGCIIVRILVSIIPEQDHRLTIDIEREFD